MSPRTQVIVLAVLLTIVAVFVRVHRLGAIGFYGDEETTALPARSLAEGGPAAMPSGMRYRRALPMTWMNAQAAKVFGLDQELPYRLPAALLGALAVPLLFLLARRDLGTTAAFLAATALALSEWHLSHSREARMYSGVLLFFMLTGFAAWRWAQSGKWLDLLWFFLAFLAATTIHHQAIFAVSFALVPLAFRRGTKAHPALHIGVCVAFGVIGMLFERWVKAPYLEYEWPGPDAVAEAEESVRDYFAGTLNLALAGLGALAGAFAGWSGEPRDDTDAGAGLRTLARVIVAAVFGAFAWSGHGFGAGMVALIYLLIHDGDRRTLLRRVWLPAGLCVLVLAGRVGLAVVQSGVGAGVKSAFLFPYPTAIWIGQMFPGLYALFVGGALWLALRKPREDQNFLRLAALLFFLPTLAIGVATRYAPPRYVFVCYPFMLAVGSFALAGILGRLLKNKALLAGAAGAVLIVAGALGGHGALPAWRLMNIDYGDPLNETTFSFPFYPDHKTTGLFVRERLQPGDRVVAVDMLQQYWYTGQVDFWLRDFDMNTNFMYADENGLPRDSYVGSRAIPDEILPSLVPTPGSRLWVITSGEITYRTDQMLSEKQNAWLREVEKNPPAYEAKDGAGKVYLLEASR